MTSQPVSDLQAMLAGMEPVLDDRPYRFLAAGAPQEFAAMYDRIFAIIYEDEGQTIVVRAQPEDDGPPFGRITLMVHSSLEGVGLTAAVSNALAAAGIACNVIAGLHHDHLFVPWWKRTEAFEVLTALNKKGGG